MSLPPELDFLEPFFADPIEAARSPEWLVSDFDANVWEYDFGFKEPKCLNWDVKLNDGSRLVDKKNKELLDGLKYFLTGSTQANTAAGPKVQWASELARAVHIVDFLLLNAEQFKLAQYGLAGLGRDKLKLILSEIGSSKDTAESIYGWSKRMSLYGLNLALETSQIEIAHAITQWPELAVITPEQIDENTLDIPLELIPSVRAALYLKGLYRGSREKGNVPNSVRLSNEIYTNTIRGRFEQKPVINILTVKSGEDFAREYPPIPVATGARDKMGDVNFSEYRRTLYGLGSLHELGVPAPSTEDLMSAKNFTVDTASAGRFRSLPSQIVFGAVRNSIEFYLKHGSKIVDGFCRTIMYCKKNNIPLSKLTDQQFQKVVGEDLTSIGVEKLGISRRAVHTPYASELKGTKAEYFTKLRSNHGLIELVKILIGCTQVVTGALMGRRIGELLDLHASDCLDVSGQWLVFVNRKSTYNLFGTRQIEVRPIEPIAVKMIKNLVRMQKILKRVGFISELQGLFASPSGKGNAVFTKTSVYSFNQNLDLFCDYFETQTNEDGKRYYIRQHQLRRFFAMLFFYSSSFGGLETLQWMLGHTDVKHVWHYLTESMDGATLRGAKAQFVAEALHSGDVASFESLAALLKARYGTEDFTIVDTEELEDYLSDLMEEGSVEIEPEFIEDDEGQRFKVVARVKQVAA
ncbi:integrase [Pseudomonas shirazica]|uniref:integrase n=1 Tax=Pseudomonas TaxID=286 RepID=UPI002F6FD15A